jgi:hypothetical protein
MYIPQELNVPLLFGGFIAWWVSSRSKDEKLNNARLQRGTLIASGLIAGGSLFGVLNAFMRFGINQFSLDVHPYMESWAGSTNGEIAGLIAFALLFAYALWDSMRARPEE